MNLICPFTGSREFEKIYTYEKPPEGEIKLKISDYYREIWQNKVSKHYLSIHNIDFKDLYAKEYVEATYQNSDGILDNFKRIIALPKVKSDNKGRVNRINVFFRNIPNHDDNRKTVLDVGSGLGVFPYEMKKSGWKVTALDPDSRAAEHIKKNIGVETVCSDYFKYDNFDKKFDLVSFNKVLEHVENPTKMLQRSKKHLKKSGLVYIEVPDGEMASQDIEGKNREEFFIDHIHIFSFTSLIIMAVNAGFKPLLVERLQEPSTKYSLRAFLCV